MVKILTNKKNVLKDASNSMLQTLSSAFLAQFQNDEGQALTVVSESIPINDKIEVPFVLDNSVGRQVLTPHL